MSLMPSSTTNNLTSSAAQPIVYPLDDFYAQAGRPLPRIEPVDVVGPASIDGDGAGTANAGEEGAASIREARAVEFEVDGLRPYRHGSPASRIHWPAVARSGEMHERRIVAGAEATPLVALDAEHPASEEALDRAVRAAASLCVHLASRTGCAVLLPGSHGPTMLDARLRSWPTLHARFAVEEILSEVCDC